MNFLFAFRMLHLIRVWRISSVGVGMVWLQIIEISRASTTTCQVSLMLLSVTLTLLKSSASFYHRKLLPSMSPVKALRNRVTSTHTKLLWLLPSGSSFTRLSYKLDSAFTTRVCRRTGVMFSSEERLTGVKVACSLVTRKTSGSHIEVAWRLLQFLQLIFLLQCLIICSGVRQR